VERGAQLFNIERLNLTDFISLGLAEPLLRALTAEGYTNPTPIQSRSVPSLLEGRDLLGIAQTGTGKTAAFALPILDRLARRPERAQPRYCGALVLAPTRELAAQIAESFHAYGRFLKVSVAVVVGGVKHGPQTKTLHRGVDILVATPGRLLDHMEMNNIRLDKTEVVVLDEADHMLDLGFLVPIRKILKRLPQKRQSLFFSATMPKLIGELASEMLNDPVRVEVTPVATTAEKVRQQVYYVDASKKRDLLVDLVSKPEFSRTLVFTRTKHGADRVCRHLEAAGLSSAAIHGNKSQSQRERALATFKKGQTRVLVATDIAARGIDVDLVSHVVNFELPDVPESYVHRIGRTARAGATGEAISFCDHGERKLLKEIEKVTRQKVPVVHDHPHAPTGEMSSEDSSLRARPQRGRPQGNRPQGDRPQGDRPQGAGARPQGHKPWVKSRSGARPGARPGGGAGRKVA